MCHKIFLPAGLFLVLIISGCALPDVPDTDGSDVSTQQALGDAILGPVSTREDRVARMHLATAAFFYLAADRVSRFDRDQALSILGRFEQLRGVLQRLDAAPDDVFQETRLRDVGLELAAVMIDSGLDRGRKLAGLAIGPGVGGLLTRGRVGLRQASFIEALLIDIRAATKKMRADPGFAASAKTAAAALMNESEARLRATTGARALILAPLSLVPAVPATP